MKSVLNLDERIGCGTNLKPVILLLELYFLKKTMNFDNNMLQGGWSCSHDKRSWAIQRTIYATELFVPQLLKPVNHHLEDTNSRWKRPNSHLSMMAFQKAKKIPELVDQRGLCLQLVPQEIRNLSQIKLSGGSCDIFKLLLTTYYTLKFWASYLV